MTRRQEESVRRLIQKPPRGSKLAAAKRFGVDLALTLESLRLTPTERVRRMECALRLVEEIERARRRTA